MASQDGNELFNPATSISQSFTVEKAALSVVADDKNKVYNEALPNLTYTLSGFVLEDNESVLLEFPSVTTSANQTSDVGAYDIIANGGIADNYSFEYQDGLLTITKAIATISFSNLVQEEDGTAKQPTVETSPENLSYTITFDGAIDLPTLAGTYQVVVSIDELNYEGSSEAVFEITPEEALSVSSQIELSVYPNPVQSYLKLKGLKDEIVTWRVWDIEGKVVITKTNDSSQLIDVSNLSAGMYLLIVDENGKSHQLRFIKD